MGGRAHYNYFRDYEPAIGRYVESDPIGLRGGINTFQYVLGNPLMFVDSLGLKTLGDAFAGAVADLAKNSGVGIGADAAGKSAEGAIGMGIGKALCEMGVKPGDADRCLRGCTEVLVPVRDKFLDKLPAGPGQGLGAYGIDRQLGGYIDGCTKACIERLQKGK